MCGFQGAEQSGADDSEQHDGEQPRHQDQGHLHHRQRSS